MAVLRGIDTVAEALRLEDYPMEKQELYYAIGDIEIADPQGRQMAVRDVLDTIDQDEFSSPDEVIQSICGALNVHPKAA